MDSTVHLRTPNPNTHIKSHAIRYVEYSGNVYCLNLLESHAPTKGTAYESSGNG